MSTGGTTKGLEKAAGHVGPNMTSMVDIVMCILIFFMLSMSLIPGFYLTNNTPALRGPGTVRADELTLPMVQNRLELRKIAGRTKVFAFGQMIEDLDKVLPELLRQKQMELSKDVEIIIQPEKSVRYQDVIAVYEACMKAHFEHVAFGIPRG